MSLVGDTWNFINMEERKRHAQDSKTRHGHGTGKGKENFNMLDKVSPLKNKAWHGDGGWRNEKWAVLLYIVIGVSILASQEGVAEPGCN